MQFNSNDRKVKIDAIQDFNDFNSQPLTTQAKKGEQLVSMMPAIKKAFDLMGDGIVELSTEDETLKKEIGVYDGKWFEQSKLKLLKQINDEKRANLVLSRMKKEMKKL